MLEDEMRKKRMLKIGVITGVVLIIVMIIYFAYISISDSSSSQPDGQNANSSDMSQAKDNENDHDDDSTTSENNNSNASQSSTGSDSSSTSSNGNTKENIETKINHLIVSLLNIEPNLLSKNYSNMNDLSNISKVAIPYFYMHTSFKNLYGTFETLYENCNVYKISAQDLEALGMKLFGNISYSHETPFNLNALYLGDPLPYTFTYQNGYYIVSGGAYCEAPNKVTPTTGYVLYESKIYTSGKKATSYTKFYYRELVTTTEDGQKYAYYTDAENKKTMFYLTKNFSETEKEFLKKEKKKISMYEKTIHQMVVEFQIDEEIPSFMSTELKK